MNDAEIKEAFDFAFDCALVYSAYAKTMRDFEAFIWSPDGTTFRYTFKYCPRVSIECGLSPGSWALSLDDVLLDLDAANTEVRDGYVWGVEFQDLYPGLTLLPKSKELKRWEKEVGIPFFEARIESNSHITTLMFSDLRVEELDPGFRPYEVEPRIPSGSA